MIITITTFALLFRNLSRAASRRRRHPLISAANILLSTGIAGGLSWTAPGCTTSRTTPAARRCSSATSSCARSRSVVDLTILVECLVVYDQAGTGGPPTNFGAGDPPTNFQRFFAGPRSCFFLLDPPSLEEFVIGSPVQISCCVESLEGAAPVLFLGL